MEIKQFKKLVPKSIKQLVYKSREGSAQAKVEWATITSRINRSPIVILGNQKSGTSVIAALLGEMTGLSVTIDLRKEIEKPTYNQVKSGELSFDQFVKINKLDFSRDIIKEPNLTVFYQELQQYYQQARYVFVIRDPRDNIRSILNRLKIPGNLPELKEEYQEEIKQYPAWNLVLNGQWLNLGGDNYIERLAERWNLTTDVFLQNQDQMILIGYEEFVKDKVAAITNLAQQLELKPINDIREKVNIQFQPRGDRNVKWIEFFGEDNLERIERICEDRMKYFHYVTNRE